MNQCVLTLLRLALGNEPLEHARYVEFPPYLAQSSARHSHCPSAHFMPRHR